MDSLTGMNLPPTLAGDGREAVHHLRRYYSARLESVPQDERVLFDGAYFDHFLPEDPHPNVFTDADIVALQCLGTPLRTWSAAVRILHEQGDVLSGLLIEIGHDRDLEDVPAAEIGPDWPAWRLDTELRRIPGVGSVVASKLIARKRPNLYPIQDSRIWALTGLSRTDFLRPFHREWSANQRLREQLARVREQAGLGERIGLLRTFDVVAWMAQTEADKREQPQVPYPPGVR